MQFIHISSVPRYNMAAFEGFCGKGFYGKHLVKRLAQGLKTQSACKGFSPQSQMPFFNTKPDAV